MPQLASFFIAFWTYLPWVAIGFMAAVTWRQRKESKTLMLQALGAGAAFLLGMSQWLVGVILTWMNTPKVNTAATYVFEFLSFVALLAFAIGYCGERFSRRKTTQVIATPVD